MIWKYIYIYLIYIYICIDLYERNRSWRSHLPNGERERQSESTRKREKKYQKTKTAFCLFLISDTFSTRHEEVAFERNYVSSFIRSYLNTSSSSMIRSLRRTIYFIIRSFITITADNHAADCTKWDIYEVFQLWNHRGGHITTALYRRAESCWIKSTRNDSVTWKKCQVDDAVRRIVDLTIRSDSLRQSLQISRRFHYMCILWSSNIYYFFSLSFPSSCSDFLCFVFSMSDSDLTTLDERRDRETSDLKEHEDPC